MFLSLMAERKYGTDEQLIINSFKWYFEGGVQQMLPLGLSAKVI